MCQYKYEGIIKALKYAEFTGQSVNVGLNRDDEAINIEGIIKKVDDYDFTIILEETGEKEEIPVSEVEYVEYS
ncbi:Putative ribosome maturation factor RimP [Caldanaerobius fijiensis DSM 17918]|uniref:Putative ribosome maturation factor RimP n=1 Tax=Caldanaerobius fijiensis DSM 17918 TaxID=1121256 RepID=A0A1M4VQU3_9THEO|nr:hypothetical protein [Caldanaerobius fijiensis]SHE71298.1 Putative ribosome maturation factor RimP [Caldanaerobius fijiensis DSM 17918]